MKTPTAAILTASVLLTLTGCAPQLSTSETCVELRAISSAASGLKSEAGKVEFVDSLDKLAGRASDTLKDPIRDLAVLDREWLKPAGDQDRKLIDETQKRAATKADMLKATCKL